MKNRTKKIGAGILSAVLAIGAGTVFVGCEKGNTENQILSLSVNPGVEFIVDNNDKVLSVTANNEDGLYILEKYQSFTGMTAKDAALKFLELSEEYGFVVEGIADGETITISVSGEGASKLYNDVKNKISSKVSQLGLSIAEMDKITEEELQEMVSHCYQEYSQTALDSLKQEDLINLIKSSREETKDFATEEEKLEYYKERALKITKTKIDTIKKYLDENATIAEKIKVEATVVLLNEAYALLEELYESVDNLITELNDLVKTELESYISQKEEYLEKVNEYREALDLNADANPDNDVENIQDMLTELAQLKDGADDYKEHIEQKRTEAKEQIENTLKSSINSSLQTINEYIDTIISEISLKTTELNQQVQAQINILKNYYEENSSSPWNND